MVKRTTKTWHPDFKKYMQFIVHHDNYRDMPGKFKGDGLIRWIVTGKSEIGKAREQWWDIRRESLGIAKEPGWKALTAKAIHPTGEKPCQICGKVLKLDYVYPNKTCPYRKNILQECDKEKCDIYKPTGFCSHLGPGVMSDCPDRLDGFHTYNRCCRSTEDKGRHDDNLARYGEDRRAYEFWSEGDWKAASWLMQEFRKHGLSPDHIGPISLGFCHRPKFYPMTTDQNSAKGNRLTLNDIKTLIADEQAGQQVISSHSKYIWDSLKKLAKTDADAKLISGLMRLNLHKVLTIFSIISENGYNDFLIQHFLHPEYALRQHTFVNFDPTTGTFEKIITVDVSRTEHTRNSIRYIRKTLEALKLYKGKKNRNVLFKMDKKSNKQLDFAMQCLKDGKDSEAYKYLNNIFLLLAEDSLNIFLKRKASN